MKHHFTFMTRCSVYAICMLAGGMTWADEVDANPAEAAVLTQLGSADFHERVAASRKLAGLSAVELEKLVATIADQPSAEVVVRLLREVDQRYASDDPDDQRVASETLETLARHARPLLAQGASQSLRQHWQRRIDLAVKSLEKAGAIVKKGSFTPGHRWNVRPGTALQILLGEDWRGGDEGILLFGRLGPLLGPIRGQGGLVVYLLTGHPLTEPQEAKLNQLVGTNRITRRSRVALGIVWDPTFADHVMIRDASPGGSAAIAGLGRGDLIIAIEAEDKDKLTPEELEQVQQKERLRDFDDLVERLKEYRDGSIIRLRVVRDAREQLRLHNGRLEDVKQEVIPVKLMAWAELPAR